MNRRRFMQGLAATGAAGVGLASTRGPVGDAEAIAPAIVWGAGAAVSGGIGLGWALRDADILGMDSPPEGLTTDALRQAVREASITRASNNRSTFVDNRNIIDGSEHVAYTDGKIAAIEALEEQLSQDDVADAARDASDDYYSTILKNVIESWNETVNEFLSFADRVELHPDADHEDIFDEVFGWTRWGDNSDNRDVEGANLDEEIEHELPNGDTVDVLAIEIEHRRWTGSSSASSTEVLTGPHELTTRDSMWIPIRDVDEPRDRLLNWTEFSELYEEIDDARANVNDGLTLWVDNVYSDVQSGDIDVAELITPRERAEMMAEDEGMAQAIADLAALNIPVDVEREATVYLPHVDATVRGTLGITQDQSIESGETYDPDEDIDGSVYLTYDVSLGEGTWGAYEDGIDGGEVTFTDEPWSGTTFRIHTTADESVELVADDFTPVDADGNEVDDWEDPDRWLVDISDDVETAITEIDEVDYFASDDASQFETIQLQEEFTVERIEDTSTGDEVDSMEFSSSEPQTDDNYITQEEWDDMAAENERLIEKFEDSQSSGGLGDFFDSDIGGVPTALIVVIAAAAAAFGLTN